MKQVAAYTVSVFLVLLALALVIVIADPGEPSCAKLRQDVTSALVTEGHFTLDQAQSAMAAVPSSACP